MSLDTSANATLCWSSRGCSRRQIGDAATRVLATGGKMVSVIWTAGAGYATKVLSSLGNATADKGGEYIALCET